MNYLLNVYIERNRPLWQCLCNIPGIGKKTALKVCKILGLHSETRWKDLSTKQIRSLDRWLQTKRTSPLGNDFRRIQRKEKEKHINMGSYKGIRLRLGLPVRGQNTHNNRRTARMIKLIK